MRSVIAFLLVLACGLAAGRPAGAQEAGGKLTARQHDIGKLDVSIEKFDQALGVVSRLSRPLGAETECRGICYLPNSSQPVSWRCSPQAACELHCDVNPPVGGCR